jgi:hypothetical protein
MQQPQTNIICGHCGAINQAAPGQTLLACRYCGSSQSLAPAAGPAAAADFKFVVPAAADVYQLRALVRQTLAWTPGAPDDVLDTGRFHEAGFHFRPVWLGRGSYRALWRDGPARRFYSPRTETRTDAQGRPVQRRSVSAGSAAGLRPDSGFSEGGFSRLVFAGYPGDLPPEAVHGLEAAAPIGSRLPFTEARLGGLEAPDLAVSDEEAERLLVGRIGDDLAAGAGRSDGRRGAGAGRRRDWAVETEVAFDEPLQPGLIPVAKAVYEYRGVRYPIWFEGAGLAAKWHGRLPSDPARRRRVLLGLLPLMAALIVCAVWLARCVWTGTPIACHPIPLGLALLPALLLGAARALSIGRHSRAVRRASLARAERGELRVGFFSPEYERLSQEGACRETPWLARKAHDVWLIGAAALVAAVLASFAFNDGPWSLAAKVKGLFGASGRSADSAAIAGPGWLAGPARPFGRGACAASTPLRAGARRLPPAFGGLPSTTAGRPIPGPARRPQSMTGPQGP